MSNGPDLRSPPFRTAGRMVTSYHGYRSGNRPGVPNAATRRRSGVQAEGATKGLAFIIGQPSGATRLESPPVNAHGLEGVGVGVRVGVVRPSLHDRAALRHQVTSEVGLSNAGANPVGKA